jgi:hypothetical protein
MRGAPQSGLARHIRRMNLRVSVFIGCARTATANVSGAQSLADATGLPWLASPAPSFRGNAATCRANPQPIEGAQTRTARTLTIEDRNLMTKGDELEFQFRRLRIGKLAKRRVSR